MNFKDIPEGYAIIPWTVNGVFRFYIGQGLFYSDDERLGDLCGQMYGMSPVYNEQKLTLFKNTFEEALEYCLKHPRR